MRTSSTLILAALVAVAPPAFAQQGSVRADPTALFASAFSAYSAGDPALALDRYRQAAELGHLPARWKLARMYEGGDGIERSPEAAYHTYRSIAARFGSIRPRDRDAVYVASAFVRLGDYQRNGVPGVLEPDPVAARRSFFYAAGYFGDATAQFELGRMLLTGEGGPKDVRNALRWLKSAADKDDVGATALLGSALVHGEGIVARPVEGMSMILKASENAREADRPWIEAIRAAAIAHTTPADVASARAANSTLEIGGN